MSLSWKSTTVSLMLLSCALTGCPNPNTYGTPRTTPKGEVSHTVAIEVIGLMPQEPESSHDTGFVIPTLPTYQLRYGVSENTDLGLSIRNVGSFGMDLKYNPIKGETFDLAVAPGLQTFHSEVGDGTYFNSSAIYFHLPLILGVNLGKSLSLVATPGGVFSNYFNSTVSFAENKGFLWRLGVGLNIRISEGFALQPEATVMAPLFPSKDTSSVLTAGLGFNFGKLPTF